MVTDGTLESVCRLLYLAQVPNGLSKLIVSHTVGCSSYIREQEEKDESQAKFDFD